MKDFQRFQGKPTCRAMAWLCGCAVVVALCGSTQAVASPSIATSAKSKSAATAKDVVVDINRAEVADLTQVPGIGKSTAQRIVDFRNTHGRFESVDDLLKVKGIGEKSLVRLRPYLKAGRSG